jgi:Ca2+-transporting ATPase
MNWHLLSIEAALKAAESRPEGLTASEAAERLQRFGPNELEQKKEKPAWLILLYQFKDLMILIMMAAATISSLIGETKDAIIILVIIILNAIVGFIQEYRAEKAMEALRKMTTPNARVLRQGTLLTLSESQLCPGDLISIEAGDLIPADLRLLETHALKIEEAALTGESIAAEKQTHPLQDEQLAPGDRTNMAFRGTTVTYGRGIGLVIATGMQTEIGHIASLLQEKEVKTPLQKRLSQLGKRLSLAVVLICGLIFGAGLLRGEEPLDMLLTAISVAVAGIPEALPAVVTIALALGARRMVRQQALVRRLPAVETLGSVTYICTDKTGTLTQNKMSVSEVWTPETAPERLPFTPEQTLLLCMALNHDVRNNSDGGLTGESTELALASHAAGFDFPAQALPSQFPRIAELPFDSERKMMTTVHAFGNQFLVVTKGAVESVLIACNDPDEVAMTAAANRMGQDGLRTIAYACKLMDDKPDPAAAATLESQLQACGLAGLMDPPRPEVIQAIQDCKNAGIIPVMITGDHPVTARSIARKIGLLDSAEDRMLTGLELKQLPADSFANMVEQVKVYARVSPDQKLQIVKTLQQRKQFVAMTGDGVNDAPALRRADIGVAMGIAGTDVSKEAAHMILLDDNFATIVGAVKEGRRIFDNIRKFVRYIMTGNSGEIWTIFLAPLVGLPIPLLPIHILWVNLVTDGLPSLALAKEPAERDIMSAPPRQPGESIFAHGLGWHVLWVGLLIGIVCLVAQAWALQEGDPKWQTYVFTILCFSQMGHVLAIRSENSLFFQQGLFTNPLLLGAVMLTFALHLAILYTPVLQEIFRVQPLSWKEFGACLLMSSVVFSAVEMEKLARQWCWRQKNKK